MTTRTDMNTWYAEQISDLGDDDHSVLLAWLENGGLQPPADVSWSADYDGDRGYDRLTFRGDGWQYVVDFDHTEQIGVEQ